MRAGLVEILHAARSLLEKVDKLDLQIEFKERKKQAAIPCKTCDKKIPCEQCKAFEPYLPRPYGGKIHGEGTINLDFNTFRDPGDSSADDDIKTDRSGLRKIEKVRSLDIFDRYMKCWSIFTEKQRQVLILRYRDGKKITEIAKELGKYASTVCGLLQRAEKRREQYEDMQREKKFLQRKKMSEQ